LKQQRFATEAELCAAFIAWAMGERGRYTPRAKSPWTAYAETAGWDLLLVATDGTQIGVQAKLRFNLKVLTQALPDSWRCWHDTGPDFRAILVPDRDDDADRICGALGLVLFAPLREWGDAYRFQPDLERPHGGAWHYWSPHQRCKLPAFVPDVIAGASGPVQLTDWKVAALRIVATLELRGHVTRADFRRHGVDPRRWTGPSGWLERGEQPGQFVRGTELDFDRQHPTVYAQVLVEVREQLAGVIA
jgi:hypothetical protein